MVRSGICTVAIKTCMLFLFLGEKGFNSSCSHVPAMFHIFLYIIK